MRPVDLALAVAVNLVWGLNFAITKLGVAEMPPMMVVAIRYALTAMILAPWLKWPGAKFPQIVMISFTLGFVHFSLMFTGLTGLDASVAAIAVQSQVPFSAVLAFLVFRDRLGWKRAGGIAIALSGIGLTAGLNDEAAGVDPFFLTLVVMAALAWSISHIQVKRLGQIDSLTLNAWIALLAAPQLALGTVVIEGSNIDTLLSAGGWAWFAIIYMAVGVSVFGYGVWYRLIQRYDVNQIAPLSLLAPTFGIGAGILLLGEPATPEKLIGGAMTLTGVAIVSLVKTDKKVQAS